jgi:hypothetical protein
MITVSDATAGILTGSSWVYKIRVESWRADELLEDDLPVDSASEDTDRSLRVPERLTLSVPRLVRGVSYAPTTFDAPLAAYGQRLRVLLGVGGRGTETEWIERGWFLIHEAEPSGATVTVTGVGLLTLIDEARLVSPYQPAGTLGSTLRSLLEPAITVDLTAAPTDRSVPSTINLEEDRLGAVLEILDAWGADASVGADGVYRVIPADQSTSPLLTLSRATTAIDAAGASTRDVGHNVVVVRGTAADGGQVQGVAYETTGPTAYGGPFNDLPVPYFFQSPLLTTVDQCTKAAVTVRDRLRRANGQRFSVNVVIDPRLQVGDVVALDATDYQIDAAVIEALRLPYTPGAGAMTLTLREL